MAVRKKDPSTEYTGGRNTAGMSVKGYKEDRNQKYTTKYRAGITGEEKAKSENRIAHRMWKETDDDARSSKSAAVRKSAPLKEIQERNRMFRQTVRKKK